MPTHSIAFASISRNPFCSVHAESIYFWPQNSHKAGLAFPRQGQNAWAQLYSSVTARFSIRKKDAMPARVRVWQLYDAHHVERPRPVRRAVSARRQSWPRSKQRNASIPKRAWRHPPVHQQQRSQSHCNRHDDESHGHASANFCTGYAAASHGARGWASLGWCVAWKIAKETDHGRPTRR